MVSAQRSGATDPLRDRARTVLASPAFAVLLVYAVSRVYSSALLTALLVLAQRLGLPFIGVRGAPDFVVLSGSWDGWFYRSIAERGYPATVPVDGVGHVLPNPWAFLPVFPALERAVTGATGLPTFAAGAVIATLAGAGAALALERLLRTRVGRRRALSAAALFAFGPLAFLLQAAYAESVYLLLLFVALLLIQQGRYLTTVPVVLLAAFTRPGAIAIPGTIALLVAADWIRHGRRPPGLGRAAIAVAVGTAAGLAWPFVADLVTGRPRTYLDTELSWWTGWVGRPDFVPFTPWFLITSNWLGPAGVALAAGLCAAAVLWIARRSPRELGGTVRVFSLTHLAYLVAVFLPQFSLPRLLMPLAPLLGAGAFTGTRARVRGWLAAAAALQPVAVVLLWFLSYP